MLATPDHKNRGAALVEVLGRQLQLYQRLQELARRQRTLVTRDDPQDLLALLGQRQQVLEELKELSARTAALQSAGGALDEDTRREARQLLEQASRILQNVLSADEHDSRLLRSRRARTAEQLTAIGARGDAFRAYSDRKDGLPSNTDHSA